MKMENLSVLYMLDLIGTAAFAASGAWAGISRKMDLFGVIVLALVTATGGGTIRDIILGATPPFCLQDETYLYLSAAVAILVFFSPRLFHFIEHPLLYFDALGLGTFLVIGTDKALAYKLGPLGSVLMGTMTATAGGMVRDVLSGEVPLILRKEIYASACIAGGLLLVILNYIEIDNRISFLISALLVILLRVAAIHFKWSLPRAEE
jgi:uncharacterized membrane protein YeiH